MSQTDLGALLGGKTQSWVSKVEAGEIDLTNRIGLADIARALRISVTDITGQPVPAQTRADWATRVGVNRVRGALFFPDVAGPLRSIDDLFTDADLVMRAWEHADYENLGERIPTLLAAATLHYERDQSERSLDLIVRACVAGSLAYRPIGWQDLALAFAERARWAADLRGDPTGIAAAAYVTSQCARADGRFGLAYRMATQHLPSLDAVRGPDARTWSVMLNLQAGLAISATGDEADWAPHVEAALTHTAGSAGGSWDALVPNAPNAHLWRLSIELDRQDSDPDLAPQLVAGVDVQALRTPQRRSRLYLEEARAWFRVGRYPATVRSLRRAYDLAPMKIGPRTSAREMVVAMADRGYGSAGLRELAGLVGVGGQVGP